jgi:hypothetical protein
MHHRDTRRDFKRHRDTSGEQPDGVTAAVLCKQLRPKFTVPLTERMAAALTAMAAADWEPAGQLAALGLMQYCCAVVETRVVLARAGAVDVLLRCGRSAAASEALQVGEAWEESVCQAC